MKTSIYDECRKILLNGWDPIGVKGFEDYSEETEDEYNSYARGIAARLEEGRPDIDLSALLTQYELNMGITPNPERIAAVAAKLREIGKM